MKIDLTINGAGGLDVGKLKECSHYYLYIIEDSCGTYPRAAIASLDSKWPQLPMGYDLYRKVGRHFHFTKGCLVNKHLDGLDDFHILNPNITIPETFWTIKNIENTKDDIPK